MASTEEIRGKIHQVVLNIAEDMDIEEEKVKDDANLVGDLGLDSMAMLEILAGIEKEFGVKIPETEFPELVSINACVEKVEKYL